MPATSPSDLFQHLDLEALALAVAQVHAQQHRGPVLRFGAAGTGLDVDEAVVRVQSGWRTCGGIPSPRRASRCPAISAAMLFRLSSSFSACAISNSSRASLRSCSILVQVEHHAFQHLALAAQFLRALGVLPDGRVFGEFDDFGQAFLLAIVVKDTSAIRVLRAAQVLQLVGEGVELFGFHDVIAC